jgi:outer membrane protein TolC
MRWLIVVALMPGLAAAAPKTDRKSFEAELDKVFADDGLTAEAAAARGAKAAPVIARKAASLDAASADLSRARLSLVPIIAGRATYTKLSPLEDVVIPLGPQMFVIPFFEDSYAATAQVTINLSDYFVRDRALIGGAGHARDGVLLDMKATAAAIAQQTREVYYEWLRAQLQKLVAKRQLAQVETTRGQIKSLVDAQRASTADLARVDAQLAQARQLIDRSDSAAIVREEQLRLLIGAKPEETLAVGEDIRKDGDAPDVGELDELASRALAQRQELKALAEGIRAKEEQRRSEASTLVPRISAFASVDYSNPNPRVFPQQDEFKLTWLAGLQASWVINESLAANQVRNRYAAEANELRADRKAFEHQVRLEVLRAIQGVRLAQRAIETTREGVDAAEESYRIRKELFAATRASVVEMVDAETELSRARIAALDARIDLRIALTRLAYATGDSQGAGR